MVLSQDLQGNQEAGGNRYVPPDLLLGLPMVHAVFDHFQYAIMEGERFGPFYHKNDVNVYL